MSGRTWPPGMRVWRDPVRLRLYPEARTRVELFKRSDGVHWRMSHRLRGTTIDCAHSRAGFATESAAREDFIAFCMQEIMRGNLAMR